jgi:hypothetical protein
MVFFQCKTSNSNFATLRFCEGGFHNKNPKQELFGSCKAMMWHSVVHCTRRQAQPNLKNKFQNNSYSIGLILPRLEITWNLH